MLFLLLLAFTRLINKLLQPSGLSVDSLVHINDLSGISSLSKSGKYRSRSGISLTKSQTYLTPTPFIVVQVTSSSLCALLPKAEIVRSLQLLTFFFFENISFKKEVGHKGGKNSLTIFWIMIKGKCYSQYPEFYIDFLSFQIAHLNRVVKQRHFSFRF